MFPGDPGQDRMGQGGTIDAPTARAIVGLVFDRCAIR
jgi:hypothetical protein